MSNAWKILVVFATRSTVLFTLFERYNTARRRPSTLICSRWVTESVWQSSKFSSRIRVGVNWILWLKVPDGLVLHLFTLSTFWPYKCWSDTTFNLLHSTTTFHLTIWKIKVCNSEIVFCGKWVLRPVVFENISSYSVTYMYGLNESAAAIQKLPGKAVTRSSKSKSTCPAIEHYLERVKINERRERVSKKALDD